MNKEQTMMKEAFRTAMQEHQTAQEQRVVGAALDAFIVYNLIGGIGDLFREFHEYCADLDRKEAMEVELRRNTQANIDLARTMGTPEDNARRRRETEAFVAANQRSYSGMRGQHESRRQP
jgi:hypothetical protein